MPAQNVANRWYFGYKAGLDFSSGSPVAVNDGMMEIWEGAATISDSQGNLLFYTNGTEVWNAIHDTMANGTNLGGVGSVTQGCVIVPQPGDTSRYFIFTTDALENGLVLGLRFSLVDMDLQGGLGEVVQKNFFLFTQNTERITALRHGNGVDYWVLAHEYGNDKFHAYLVDSNGVSLAPVISQVGTAHTNLAMAQGCIKASPTGERVAIAVKSANLVEIFDFDSFTGVLSHPITVPGVPWAYGLEFSCDGSKLYCTGVSNLHLQQIDLSAGSDSLVIQSLVTVDTLPTSAGGTLQLARDGKIYYSMDQQQYLGVVEFPNLAGAACQSNSSAIFLNGAMTGFGLANFVPQLFQCLPTTAVAEPLAANISIVPNPARSGATVRMMSESEISWIRILDLRGRELVFSEEINRKAWELTLEGIESGLLLVQIGTVDGGRLVERLLVR